MRERESTDFGRLLWEHRFPTVVYWLVFWSFGMCVGFLGPTLWDLGCQTATELPTMTWIFFSQSLFILIGSMFSGVLIIKFHSHPMLLISVIGVAAMLLSIVLCHSMLSLALVLAVMGFFMGIVDTAANVSMIKLYKTNVTPFLQALHFFYGLGAFLSPLIAEPFLRSIDCTRLITNDTNHLGQIERAIREQEKQDQNLQNNQPQTLAEAQAEIRVHFAFWIMAALQVPVILSVLALVIFERVKKKPKAGKEGEYQDMDNKSEGEGSCSSSLFSRCWINSSWTFILVILLAAILLFFADGMQASFGSLVFSYGRLSVSGMTSEEAAVMDAAFWGTFALGRLISIGAALCVSAGLILCTDILGAFLAILMMALFPHSHVMLYVGTTLFGLFLSSIYPSTISLAEQFVDVGREFPLFRRGFDVPCSASAASCMVVGAAAGEMLYPVLIGHLFDEYGPMSFLVAGNLTLCLTVFVFITLLILGNFANSDSPTNFFKSLADCLHLKRNGENSKLLGRAEPAPSYSE